MASTQNDTVPLNFELVQRLPTSGARAVEPFEMAGEQYLAVAQMALDIPGQAAGLNSGSSQTNMPIYRWANDKGAGTGQFAVHQQLDVPGGEDAEFFRIGERQFLATASIRTGDGPYVLDAQSVIFEWRGTRFEPFQAIPTFAAKQWRHFSIDGRHFLALAQGVVMPGVAASHPSQSCIFEWDGACFALFQTITSAWGYNWKYFEISGRRLLAYADHAAPSRLLQWTGKRFEDFQILDAKSGRAFSFFAHGGEFWLACANLLHDSVVYRWTGSAFEQHQILCGPGAREFLWLEPEKQSTSGGQLIQANFLLGSRDAPRPMAESCVYQFSAGQLKPVSTFETSGAVDLAGFFREGARYLAIANSLSPALRLRTDAMVYKVMEAAP